MPPRSWHCSAPRDAVPMPTPNTYSAFAYGQLIEHPTGAASAIPPPRRASRRDAGPGLSGRAVVGRASLRAGHHLRRRRAAIADRRIVRTWLMRGTLHFAPPKTCAGCCACLRPARSRAREALRTARPHRRDLRPLSRAHHRGALGWQRDRPPRRDGAARGQRHLHRRPARLSHPVAPRARRAHLLRPQAGEAADVRAARRVDPGGQCAAGLALERDGARPPRRAVLRRARPRDDRRLLVVGRNPQGRRERGARRDISPPGVAHLPRRRVLAGARLGTKSRAASRTRCTCFPGSTSTCSATPTARRSSASTAGPTARRSRRTGCSRRRS